MPNSKLQHRKRRFVCNILYINVKKLLQFDSPQHHHVKKWEFDYFALKPELVGESSASVHRTDKAPITTCHFRATRLKSNCLVLTAWTGSTYGLDHSASPYLFQKTSCNQQPVVFQTNEKNK